MAVGKVEFRRKRRRLENPPENDSESSGDDAGSSDGAYDELYDTDNGDDDDDDNSMDNQDDNNDDIMETLEEDELQALHRKRKLQEVYGAEKSRKKSKDGVKVPTSAEEVKRLRETEKLFHSNLHRLQIEEMLKEVKIKTKYSQKFEEWFPLLQASLLQMEEQEEQDLSDLDWIPEGIVMPLHQNHEFKGRFVFQPPTSVSTIGSYADGCSLGPKINVDVAVQMPESMFFKKDYRNERFHRKRSLFLCCIAAHLQSSNLISQETETSPRFTLSYGGDSLLPVVQVSPSGYLADKVVVRIHAFAPATIFKLNVFSPSKNNVDAGLFYPDAKTEHPATPIHNASTLAALVATENEAEKKSAIASHQNILDALILLKVWLRQRGLDQGCGGFSSYLMSMLVVYMIRQRKISPQMSSYQVVRIVWNFLSETNWTKPEGAPSLSKNKDDVKNMLGDFASNYEVVFVDVTGYYNLAYNVNASTYNRVRSESRLALQFLDNPTVDSFQALFITSMPFCRQFDHILRFKNPKKLEAVIDAKATLGQKIDGAANRNRLVMSLILPVLERGLSKRVAEWGVQSAPMKTWSIKRSPPKQSSSFVLGINLDPQHAFAIIDKGPAANEPEAKEFREFWGEKSELRRFQDGSISEAVVWLDAKASVAERRVICKSIVEYLLEHRLGLQPAQVLVYIADQIETTLRRPKVKHPDFTYGTGEAAALTVISAFGRLSKTIRELKDLPLEITEIQGISPTFRYTEVFPPVACPLAKLKSTVEKENCLVLKNRRKAGSVPSYVPALEVIVSLGLSGKWPSTPEAVRRIRAAFNIKIAKSLRSSFKLTTQAHPDYVDVIQDGFVFRLRVAYQNEIALLKETTLPDGSVKYRDTPESISLERKIVHLPNISGCLHGLHLQSPAFGPTACLAKRWLSSQMMVGEHIPEIVVELLAAHVFLHPEPYCIPAQPQTAFLRFLHFIGRTNWHTFPVILNFKGDISREEVSEIEKYFESHRKELPPLFIATLTDHKKSLWTSTAPILPILVRLAQLAQAALAVLEDTYNSTKSKLDSWNQIFVPDLSIYDALIHLKPFMVSRRKEALSLTQVETDEVKQFQLYKREEGEKIPITDFDTAQLYLRDLRASFGDFALFSYNIHGGNVIGVVWKPTALEPRKFSVNQVNGRHLLDGKLVLNREAILEDFSILGKGLVSHVDTPGRPGRAVPDDE